MRVKICGITNYDDAIHAIESGADALGFVFYGKSPRYISPEEARRIIDKLPPFVERVGLFVNETPESVNTICQHSGVSLAQIHFDVDESFLDALETKSLPVIRAQKAEDLERFADRYRLVDAYVDGYGGEGKRVALDWFKNRDNSQIILAGGLDPDNVSQIAGYGFYGVDASSGVEASKGVKDSEKVRRFIANAKSI